MAKDDFLSWGIHTVRAALQRSPTDILEIWLKSGELSSSLQRINEHAAEVGLSIQRVPIRTLDRLSSGGVHQGVVLRRRVPLSLSLESYLGGITQRPGPPLLAILDHVQDPQNLGACLRIADGSGADAVLITRAQSAPINGTVAKAAAGALDTVPIIAVANLARALDELREAGVWIIGTTLEASGSLWECDLTESVGLVFGGEATGMRRLTREKCDQLIRIPMHGTLASINISTAAAVTLFEARRQRA